MKPRLKLINGDWYCTMEGTQPMFAKTPAEAYRYWYILNENISRISK